jgi:hypothetical protein
MRRALSALLALAAVPAAAQPLVVSPRPDSVSVTVYRNPERDADDEMELDWLEGFALITETRTFRLPAGESVVRFEGVAGGIEPASAIVVGLPGGVGEKNRDARLISPGALVERALGRRVHIRRTNPKTGTVTEEEGIIRSGPGGVILQTREGFEALRCSGLPEDLVFSEVPADLSATPTLAVTTRSPADSTVTVRLSYLARQFDWQADYIASLADDGKTMDLFAWLTLANGNDESFPDARTQAVAGSLNRDEESDDEEPAAAVAPIEARCWPRGSTSDLPLILPPPPPVAPDVLNDLPAYESAEGDIVVTGSRMPAPNLLSVVPVVAISAEQEELGDLKLYRIPEPVTVSAHAQKQVALLSRSKVPIDRIYAVELRAGSNLDEPVTASIRLRTKNVAGKKLGLPLPQGKVALFETVANRPMLLAESEMAESAIGQEIEIDAGESPDVSAVQYRAGRRCSEAKEEEGDCERGESVRRRGHRMVVQVSNARPEPVTVEVVIPLYHPWEIEDPSRDFVSKNGHRMWVARVPANGRWKLTFVLRRGDEPRNRRDDDDD